MKTTTAYWLEAASLDIENINHIIQNERLSGHVAYHAQQAIEKTLKAAIEEKGFHVPKIHSLSKLFAICDDIFFLKPDEDIIIALDSLYTESRYPSEFGLLPNGKPSIDQANVFYEFAKKVYGTVKECLKNT